MYGEMTDILDSQMSVSNMGRQWEEKRKMKDQIRMAKYMKTQKDTTLSIATGPPNEGNLVDSNSAPNAANNAAEK